MSLSSQTALPLLYSCSGCSSAAQMTNQIALALDRERIAEMSCIAGIGGNVTPLVGKARGGRPLVALDGCPLECARHCLEQRGLTPRLHVVLTRLGVRKRYHADFDEVQAEEILAAVRQLVVDMAGSAHAPTES